jgi:hypothetical protein
MYKYRYFPILFGGLNLLLISLFFPVSFDNNDDQMMYFISAGVLSEIPSANLLLSSLLTGKVLNTLFRVSDSVNWYTLLLQLIQLSSLVCLLFVFIEKQTGYKLTYRFADHYRCVWLWCVEYGKAAIYHCGTILHFCSFVCNGK